MKSGILVAAAAAAVLALSACTSINPYTGQEQISNTAGGALLGGATGAVAGALIGNATGADGRVAALIGAGIGALAGGAIGNYMDEQEAELRAQLAGSGVSVTRVGDRLILNMPSSITFAVDKATVQPRFRNTLAAVGIVLKKYNRTIVDVYGHTDSSGDDAYNLDLSQDRAVAVATILANEGVDQRRFFIEGLGEEEPIASNETETGRAQNRRVEIQLTAIQG